MQRPNHPRASRPTAVEEGASASHAAAAPSARTARVRRVRARGARRACASVRAKARRLASRALGLLATTRHSAVLASWSPLSRFRPRPPAISARPERGLTSPTPPSTAPHENAGCPTTQRVSQDQSASAVRTTSDPKHAFHGGSSAPRGSLRSSLQPRRVTVAKRAPNAVVVAARRTPPLCGQARPGPRPSVGRASQGAPHARASGPRASRASDGRLSARRVRRRDLLSSRASLPAKADTNRSRSREDGIIARPPVAPRVSRRVVTVVERAVD